MQHMPHIANTVANVSTLGSAARDSLYIVVRVGIRAPADELGDRGGITAARDEHECSKAILLHSAAGHRRQSVPPTRARRRGPRVQLQRIRTFFVAFRSAPSRKSSTTVAVWPLSEAFMSAVQPHCSTGPIETQ
jgi:hypothetical protein